MSFLLLISFILILWFITPDPSFLKDHNPKTTALMKFRMEFAQKNGKKYYVNQKWKPLREISPYLINAVLISEDDRFYSHWGIDWIELKESIKKDIKKKRFVRGASTISQQVVKNLYLTPRKTILRKLTEVILALKLEMSLPKKRILEIYLNIVEWGNGIYGAESASQFYFGKSAKELSPYESASLASILPNPLRYSPDSNSRFVKKRRERILNIMKRRGILKDLKTANFNQGHSLDFLTMGEEILGGLTRKVKF